MTKHTKGPWSILGDDRNEQIQVVAAWGGLVAVATHECVMPRPELEANARLIATAPELLEALEKALRESGCDGDLCMHDWHDDARAALAKARGE